MPNHLLGNSQVDIVFAVVHLELETDEVGQDGGGPGLGADGGDLLAGFGALDGETIFGWKKRWWLARLFVWGMVWYGGTDEFVGLVQCGVVRYCWFDNVDGGACLVMVR